MLNIYDAIGDIVARTSGVTNYIYGSPAEIQQRLINWGKSVTMKDSKYPCVILFTPIEQLKEQDARNSYAEVSLDIVIVTGTEKTYSTPDRMVNSYATTLHPIYESFIEQIRLSRFFDIDSSGRIPHKTTDLFYYSPTPANEQNVFSAILDAVEISNLELKLITQTPDECLK